jgi:hypothetical protein
MYSNLNVLFKSKIELYKIIKLLNIITLKRAVRGRTSARRKGPTRTSLGY